MNVKIVTEDDKEIAIKDLNKDFVSQLLKENPFGVLLMSTLKLAGEALKEEIEELIDFSDALDVLKDGGKVVRKSWIDGKLNVSYLLLFPEGQTNTGMISESFIGVVSIKEDRFEPYIIQNDDLLAEDWLVIK